MACARPATRSPEPDTLIQLRPVLLALFAVPAFGLIAQAATTFRDIPPGHWARRPAGILHDRQIMPGRTPVDFAGEVALSRYELAKILSELYNTDGPPGTFLVLKDQPPGHALTQEVQRVLGYGLMVTKRPGVFEGDAPVSRKELVEALDTVLTKDGVAAPTRRKNPVFFTDVQPGSRLGLVLDRIVNRYALMDARAFTPFYPHNTVTRFQVLAMLVRAMPYVNTPVAIELKEPPTRPSPLASGESPPPATPTPEGSTEPDESPEPTENPTPTPPRHPAMGILRTRGWGQAEWVALYSESLPTATGTVTSTDPKQYSVGNLGSGNLNGEYWNGPGGASLKVSTLYIGQDLIVDKRSVAVDFLDTTLQAHALYKVAAGFDWEVAIGGGGIFRSSYNISAPQLVGRQYQTTDKTYFGPGGTLVWGLNLGSELNVTGDIHLYPYIIQSYNLTSGSKSVNRWGGDATLRGEYRLGPILFVTGGAHLFTSGAFDGGMQTLVGLSTGLGAGF